MMPADVLVVVDFHDADQTQRNAFAAQIFSAGWNHHPMMPNTFYKSFRSPQSDEELTTCSESEIANVAMQVDLRPWEATCIIGEPGCFFALQ